MKCRAIVILTGAGISAESGLKTFRDQNGLWENHRVEDVASPEGFARDPDLVQAFYNARRVQLQEAGVRPNAAHLALAEMEGKWSGDFLLVTQNVDDLHERAGSKALIHMHGELLKARCQKSDQVFEWREAIAADTLCPCCNEARTLRPHIVWFGEMPLEMDRIFAALHACDLFVSIGTSGNVHPAAGFVRAVPARCRTVEINLEPSLVSGSFDEQISGPAGIMVPRFVRDVIAA
jgi:NAD-dependent deacetylase